MAVTQIAHLSINDRRARGLPARVSTLNNAPSVLVLISTAVCQIDGSRAPATPLLQLHPVLPGQLLQGLGAAMKPSSDIDTLRSTFRAVSAPLPSQRSR